MNKGKIKTVLFMLTSLLVIACHGMNVHAASGATTYVMLLDRWLDILETAVNNDIKEIELMSDFGCAITTYKGNGAWTDDLKTTGKYKEIEVIARTIYGEFTASEELTNWMEGDFDAQREAVMWVIQNRVDAGNFGGSTPYEVVKAGGQFEALSGGEGNTNQARNPYMNIDENEKNAGWEHAYNIACYLYEVNDRTWGRYKKSEILYAAKGKPAGIGTQKYFMNLESWGLRYNASNNTLDGTKKLCNIALNVGEIKPVGNNIPAYNIFYNYK